MECPYCNEQIETVIVVSDYTQIGVLEGKEIVEYEEMKDNRIGSTNEIKCSKCDADLSKYVREQ